MIIRSITYTIDFTNLEDDKYLSRVEDSIKKIVQSYNENGQIVRTIRFNLIPLNDFLIKDVKDFYNKLKLLSFFSKKIGIRWFNVSFNLVNETKINIDNICNHSYKIIKEFEKVIETKIPFKIKSRRVGDAAIVVADNKKAKSLLRWNIKNNLNDICKDTIKWMNNYG